MKAAVVTQTGVEIREVPAPVPGRNHVLVRERACGLNRADRSFALAEAPAALAYMRANAHFGKIVLTA